MTLKEEFEEKIKMFGLNWPIWNWIESKVNESRQSLLGEIKQTIKDEINEIANGRMWNSPQDALSDMLEKLDKIV